MQMDKLTVPFMNRATEVVAEATVKKLPVISQSILGYRCVTTTVKCSAKAAATTSIAKRSLYVVGAICSGTAGVMFMGSAATSVIAPNISIPLMATGEACLHAGVMLDGTADGLGFIP
jgi:hypothetical protein